MRGIIFILIVLCANSFHAFSQYNGKVWSDSLAERANQITLFDRTNFTILDAEASVLTRHYKIGILNKFAKSGRVIDLYYDKFSNIKNAQVYVTDKQGKKLKSYGLREFEDWSNIDESMASDSRSKYLEIVGEDYPYFIEVAYEIENKASLHYDNWLPIESENHALLEASFEVIAPSKEDFRSYEKNIEAAKTYQKSGEYHAIWKVENIKAFVKEAFSPGLLSEMPMVFMAPNAFEIDGFKGNMSSWESIGQWQNKLNQGRDNLSKDKYDAITAKANQYTETIDKIKAVYQYLQENFRYVSIQLGIGGWQPFETEFVNEKKYGDCKALSFYTKNILEHLGIPAYYTLIRAGKTEIEIPKDFPIRLFNHVILTVPLEDDTLFLECTSQTNPFAYLGSFTSDRNALMVTPNGGKLIRTKAYDHTESFQSTNVSLTLNENGDANTKVRREYHCLAIPNSHESLEKANSVKQKQWLYDYLNWGNLTITNYSVESISYERLPKAGFQLEGEIAKMAKKTGNRLFYTPFIFSNINDIELPESNREQPIEIKYPFTDTDTIELELPLGYQLEGKYEDLEIENKFGYYQRQIVKEDNKMQLVRRFIIYKGWYEKSEYEAFRSFIKSVQKADKQKMVFIGSL